MQRRSAWPLRKDDTHKSRSANKGTRAKRIQTSRAREEAGDSPKARPFGARRTDEPDTKSASAKGSQTVRLGKRQATAAKKRWAWDREHAADGPEDRDMTKFLRAWTTKTVGTEALRGSQPFLAIRWRSDRGAPQTKGRHPRFQSARVSAEYPDWISITDCRVSGCWFRVMLRAEASTPHFKNGAANNFQAHRHGAVFESRLVKPQLNNRNAHMTILSMIYIYIYVYVYIQVCVYIYIYIYIYIFTHTYTYTCIYVRTYVRT